MVNIYVTAKRELKYNATRFLQLVNEVGGLNAAKTLLAKDGGSSGFVELWEHGRLDLSMEAHVLKPEYNELFTENERKICKERLEQYGYKL
ncbi:hypothetical protein E9840_11275 [Tissierella creatinini]|nr:hypothetical protein E9840_11275 [Tissierella creatinini]TJX62916.1 hypothetical protein E8P77_16330 [Soehngenia saccharolytica]